VYDPTSDSFVVVWTDLRNDANGDFMCDAGESACLDIWGLSIPRISKIPGSEKALVSDSGHQFEAILGKGGGKLLLFWIDGAIALGDNGSQNLTSPNVERALVITAP
jgi:hypothetical protein